MGKRPDYEFGPVETWLLDHKALAMAIFFAVILLAAGGLLALVF